VTGQTGSDERDHRARSDAHAFIRRMAAGLGIPLKAILDVRRDDDRHVVSVIGVNNAAGVPEVHVGTAVVTPDEAMALARDIRRIVAQQQARSPWSLLWTLIRARAVDLVADTRHGLSRVATHPTRRGGAR
jgi:hypothetical protein